MAKKVDYKVKLPLPNIRPDSRITPPDAQMLDMYILSDMEFTEVWMMFKGKTGTKTTNQSKASQFFALHDTKIYLEERRKQLNDYIENKSGETSTENYEVTKDDFKQLLKIAVDHAKNVDDPLHVDALKALLSKAAKFLETEDKQEPPRRYMPETCSNCRYRKFCEQECEDECDKCKYKEYANQNGVSYTPQTQLNK